MVSALHPNSTAFGTLLSVAQGGVCRYSSDYDTAGQRDTRPWLNIATDELHGMFMHATDYVLAHPEMLSTFTAAGNYGGSGVRVDPTMIIGKDSDCMALRIQQDDAF